MTPSARHSWPRRSIRSNGTTTTLPSRAANRSIRPEPIVGILEGKVLVHAHSYVSQEMQALIDDSDEFHFHIASLEHCLEAYKIANELKSHNIGCSTFADDWSYKMEAVDGIAYNAALLEQKGVRAAINSD